MRALQSLRRLLVSFKDRYDRHRHPERHRRARAWLQDNRPRTILFVCLGNVCRSPYAERIARVRLTREVFVDSAGFIGPDRSPPEDALAVARRRGVEHGDHRSKIITGGMAAEADAVFVFDRFNVARMRSQLPGLEGKTLWLGDLDPSWTGKRAIKDPWGNPESEFEVAFERIERCIDVIAEVLDPTAGHPGEGGS